MQIQQVNDNVMGGISQSKIQTLDDVVMGGQSTSSIITKDDTIMWSGHLKLVPYLQKIGFVSLQTTYVSPYKSGLQITVQSMLEPQSLILQLVSTQKFRNGFQPATVIKVTRSVKTVFVNYSDFELFFRGNWLKRIEQINSSQIVGLNIILTDGKPRKFKIKLQF